MFTIEIDDSYVPPPSKRPCVRHPIDASLLNALVEQLVMHKTVRDSANGVCHTIDMVTFPTLPHSKHHLTVTSGGQKLDLQIRDSSNGLDLVRSNGELFCVNVLLA